MELFLDIEGVPDRQLYYLIGLLVSENDTKNPSTAISPAQLWVSAKASGIMVPTIDESDMEKHLLAQFLAAWEEMDPEGKGLYTSDVMRNLEKSNGDECPLMRAAMAELGATSAKELGVVLGRFQGRIVDGKCFTHGARQAKGFVWRVATAKSSNSSGDTNAN